MRFLATDSPESPSTSTAPSTSPEFLVTSSKDTFLKLWDLSARHCVQTVVAHRAEIWTLDLDQSGSTIFTGSAEGELKAWKIDLEAMRQGLKESDTGEVGIRQNSF
jgi:U3 small nucleolar RNA-associated protein 12